MKKFSPILLWIPVDILLAVGIVLLPSLISIFCFATAVLFIPIKKWQQLLKKIIKRAFIPIVISVCLAFLIVHFPFSTIKNLIDPPPASNNFKTQSSEPSVSENTKSSNKQISSESPSSHDDNCTSYDVKKAYNDQPNNSTEVHEGSSEEIDSNENQHIGYFVYRTPSGERYHLSPTCGGKNSYEIPFDDAINSGLTPCKKCVE